MNENNDIDITSVGRIERLIRNYKISHPLISDWETQYISFEYICASLFPNVWENITEELKKANLEGYQQCIQDIKIKGAIE